jgi:hypothetical protein
MVTIPDNGAANRRLTAHAKNIRSPTAAASQKLTEGNGMIRATHPYYSPDSALYDFYLFGYVKHCLRGRSFETAGELFSTNEVISMVVEKSTLDVVHLKWMQRLREYIATNGDYFEGT